MLKFLSAGASFSPNFLACRGGLGKRRIFRGMRRYRIANRVPGAVRRCLRCSAEPGPLSARFMDPGSAAHHAEEWRAAQHPGNAGDTPSPSRGMFCPGSAYKRPSSETEGAGNGFNGFLRARPGDRALLSPSPARMSHQLDISVGTSGPHDFAVRLQRIRLLRRKRPSHPAPNVRDDRDTPLL